MAATYKAQIRARWDWERIVKATYDDAFGLGGNDNHACAEGCDSDGHVGSAYLGSVMANAPSGKYYMPWTTNQTADDVDRDSRWYAALDEVAVRFSGWIESGEGDPTDLYFMRYWPTPKRND